MPAGCTRDYPCVHDVLRLVATRSAISRSRLFVAFTLDTWDARAVINDAVQVVDELVTAGPVVCNAAASPVLHSKYLRSPMGISMLVSRPDTRWPCTT